MTLQEQINLFLAQNLAVSYFVVFLIALLFWRVATIETLLFVCGFIIYVSFTRRGARKSVDEVHSPTTTTTAHNFPPLSDSEPLIVKNPAGEKVYIPSPIDKTS